MLLLGCALFAATTTLSSHCSSPCTTSGASAAQHITSTAIASA